MEGLRDCDTVINTHHDKFEEPCKFITKDFELVNQDYIKNRLTQNTGFIVVGVIGKQTVGKSFILNMLANNCDDIHKNKPFETSTNADLLNYLSKTSGTDIHVTEDRVILLDSQHILNVNHLGVSMEKEKKIKVYSNDDESEGKIKMSYSADILAVQMMSYFLSVCHVVLVVDDHIINYRLLRLLDLAHRLKPWIPCNPSHLPLDEPRNSLNHGDSHVEFHDYVAQTVFVENMCGKRHLNKDHIMEYIDCISQSLIGYRVRTDEQNALHCWLKDMKIKQTQRYNAKLKKRFKQQREKLHNNSSSVVQLDGDKSDNGSDNESITLAPSEDVLDMPVNAIESISDCEDDEVLEKRLNRSIHRSVKLFQMPLFKEDDPNFQQEVRSFQQMVFGMPRKHFCVTQNERFTEQCWLEFAIEMWHNIRNSQIFTEYFFSFSNILINDF